MTDEHISATHASLDRVIGVPGVAFAGFNGIVGMGIFALPGLIAGLLGASAIFAYVICLALVGLIGLCFAEAGSRVQASGGIYAYIHAAFGPIVGGVAGLLIVVANSIGTAAALVRFLLDTLASAVPGFSPSLAFAAVIALYALLVVVNVRGARDGSRLLVGISILKLAPLILLAVAGLFAARAANLAMPALPAAGGFGQATLLLFFAFIGIETGCHVSGETRNPARTIPLAILLTLSLVAALYIGLQVAAQGVLGAALPNAPAPLVDMARFLFGRWGAGLLLATTLLSVIGYCVTDMLASPRVIYALADAGQLPRRLAWVHPRHHTPAMAIILYPITILLVAASGSFRQIAIFSTAGSIVLYLMVCVGVLRLRARGTAEAGRPFVIPGGAIVPLGAAALILWLLSTLSWPEMAATAGFILVAAAIYVVQRRVDTTKG